MRIFYKDIQKKCSLWIVVFLLAVFSHGTMLLGGSIGIDTEDIIALQSAFYEGWLSVGRQGLVFLKWLFGTSIFNPQLAGVMTLLFLTVACMFWTSLFSCISGKSSPLATFIFSALLLVSPMITEQVYFKLQSMEVTFGFCLMAVSLFFVYWAAITKVRRKKYLFLLGSVILNIILFSLYQVMVPLFLFGASACFFLYCFFQEDASAEIMKKLGVFYLIAFFAGFVLNQTFTIICFSGETDYLTTQIQWFTQPFIDSLISICRHVKVVLLGEGIYYSKFYPLGCLLLIGIVLYRGRDHKNKAAYRGSVVGLLMTIATPFYMTVLCAGEPVRRSQMVMPFALAFVAYVLILQKRGNKRAVLLILCMVTGYVQLSNTMRLNYTDSVRYESDVRTAYALMEDLNELGEKAHVYPIVFIGKRPAELNNSCVVGETIGSSFFEQDAEVEPRGFYSTRRMIHFMHVLGGDYHRGDETHALKAAEYSKHMEIWPKEGSIVLQDECIIVKLSD